MSDRSFTSLTGFELTTFGTRVCFRATNPHRSLNLLKERPGPKACWVRELVVFSKLQCFATTMRTWEGREEGREKCQAVYLSLDDRTRLKYTMYNSHWSYRLIGKCIQLLDPLQSLPCRHMFTVPLNTYWLSKLDRSIDSISPVLFNQFMALPES